MSRKQLAENRQKLLERCQQIEKSAASEERAMTEDERGVIADLLDTVDGIDNLVTESKGGHIELMNENGRQRVQRRTGDKFRCADGREIVAARRGEPLASETPDFSLGEYLYAMVANDGRALPSGAMNAMSVGSDTTGGYLADTVISPMVVDLSRSQMQIMNAGAQSMMLPAGEVHIARLTQDPTSYWRGELEAITASSAAFDRISLTPKVIACQCFVSVEWLQDTINGPALLQDAMTKSIALKVDQAALGGTGAGSEPLGIRNASGTNAEASVGTPTNWDEVDSAVGLIYAQNFPGQPEDLSWLSHPRDVDTLSILKDTTLQPLMPSSRVSRLRHLQTTSISTTEGGGSNESYGVVGDFSQMLLGFRNQVSFRIADAGADSDGNNAVTQLGRIITAYVRMDVAILKPAFFTIMTGITA